LDEGLYKFHKITSILLKYLPRLYPNLIEAQHTNNWG